MRNYFSDREAIQKCRDRFRDEIKKGRMLGGPGWNREMVENFLGTGVYTIPCGCVPKEDEPVGRIIHDYSFPKDGRRSINSSLLDNSVQYITSSNRIHALSRVSWYISVDLEAGYRQLSLHPE